MKTKYDKYGALHVDKESGRLVDRNKENVTLHGFSTHNLSQYPEYVNREFFKFMRDEWKVDAVRLALYTDEEDGYCVGSDDNKKKLLRVIDDGVRYATELGLYVIIDWHILLDYSPFMYKDEAIRFWDYISAKYSAYGNIFYEICNEPNMDCNWRDVKSYAEDPDKLNNMLMKPKCEWSDIKAYAKEVIPVIRKNDPYAVIIVGTPVWSQRVDEAAADPIDFDGNVMYTLHFYANTHKDELRSIMKGAADEKLPIFVTEFSTCSADGAGSHNKEEADKWVELMDSLGISYMMWSISNKDETSASFYPECTKKENGFTDEDLRDPAKWFVEILKEHSK